MRPRGDGPQRETEVSPVSGGIPASDTVAHAVFPAASVPQTSTASASMGIIARQRYSPYHAIAAIRGADMTS